MTIVYFFTNTNQLHYFLTNTKLIPYFTWIIQFHVNKKSIVWGLQQCQEFRVIRNGILITKTSCHWRFCIWEVEKRSPINDVKTLWFQSLGIERNDSEFLKGKSSPKTCISLDKIKKVKTMRVKKASLPNQAQ